LVATSGLTTGLCTWPRTRYCGIYCTHGYPGAGDLQPAMYDRSHAGRRDRPWVAVVVTGTEPSVPTTALSTWAPLRHRVFLGLWIAQLASNVGSFMQNVGAAWLMGDLGGSALAVSSIQARSPTCSTGAGC
jgi:hypothetical protein